MDSLENSLSAASCFGKRGAHLQALLAMPAAFAAQFRTHTPLGQTLRLAASPSFGCCWLSDQFQEAGLVFRLYVG